MSARLLKTLALLLVGISLGACTTLPANYDPLAQATDEFMTAPIDD